MFNIGYSWKLLKHFFSDAALIHHDNATIYCIVTIFLSEVEMAFNGIVSLIMLVPVNEADEIISLFAEIVSKAPPGDKRGHLRLRL